MPQEESHVSSKGKENLTPMKKTQEWLTKGERKLKTLDKGNTLKGITQGNSIPGKALVSDWKKA